MSAYVGSSKNLKDQKDPTSHQRALSRRAPAVTLLPSVVDVSGLAPLRVTVVRAPGIVPWRLKVVLPASLLGLGLVNALLRALTGAPRS